MKPPFLKELYISSSLPNNSTLEESENQKTEIMKLNNDGSEDATYRVWFKRFKKNWIWIILVLNTS